MSMEGAVIENQVDEERSVFHLRLEPVGYCIPTRSMSVAHAIIFTARLKAAKYVVVSDKAGSLYTPGIRGRIPDGYIESTVPA